MSVWIIKLKGRCNRTPFHSNTYRHLFHHEQNFTIPCTAASGGYFSKLIFCSWCRWNALSNALTKSRNSDEPLFTPDTFSNNCCEIHIWPHLFQARNNLVLGVVVFIMKLFLDYYVFINTLPSNDKKANRVLLNYSRCLPYFF